MDTVSMTIRSFLAFAAGNLVAALTGCCPINGSVSRTAMGEQYQGKTQLMSIVAGASMLILLVCGTGFIGYLRFCVDAIVDFGIAWSNRI